MAPIGTRSAELVLRYRLDRAELDRALTSISDVEDRVSDLNRTFSEAQRTSERAITSIGDVERVSGRRSAPYRAFLEARQAEQAIGATSISIGQLAAAAIPAALAVGALYVAIQEFQRIIEEGQARIQSAIQAQKTYFEVIQTGTTESILKSVEQQRAAVRALEGEREALQAERAAAVEASGRRRFGGRSVFTADIDKRLEEIDEELTKARDSAAAYERALQSEQVSLNDARAAQEALTESRIKAIQRESQIEQSIAQLARTGTREQLEARLAAIEIERQAAQNQISALSELDQTSAEVQSETARLRATLSDLKHEEDSLKNSALALIAAREEEQRQIDRIRETATAVEKYNEDVARIEQHWREERLRLAERFSEDQVRIARDAVEDARRELERLEQEREELRRDLARDEAQAELEVRREELEARIDFMRDEEQSAREHLDNMLDIRRRAEAQETELAFRRDFAGIARLRRETNQRLSEANQEYSRQRRERLISLEQEREDIQRHFLEEREDRLTRFEQDMKDAEDQYRRELRLIEQKRQRELAELARTYDAEVRLLGYKLSAELMLRQDEIQKELNLISQGHNARLALEASYQKRLLAQAAALMGGLSIGSSSTTAQKTVTVNAPTTINTGADLKTVGAYVDARTRKILDIVFRI